MSEGRTLCYSCMRAVSPEVFTCPFCHSGLPYVEKNSRLLQPGVSLHEGRYLVGRCIGTGGFGATYIALDTHLGIRVAIKEFLSVIVSTREINSSLVAPVKDKDRQFNEFLEKFFDEAKRLRTLHLVSCVVKCTEYFRDNGTGYFVMEYLEGKTIKDDLRSRRAAYTQREAMLLMRSLLGVLEGVHDLKVLHRDIAVDNLFLRSTGDLVLIDFGSARSDATDSHTKFSKGNYTPPEQLLGMPETSSTDLYSAGVVMFVLLCNREPVKNDGLLEPLSDTFPKPLRDLYERATRYKQADRFQTALEMRMAVEAWLNSEQGQLKEPGGASPRSLKLVWAMLGGMFLLLGLVLLLMLNTGVVTRKTYPVTVRYLTEDGTVLHTSQQALEKGYNTLNADLELPALQGLSPTNTTQYVNISEDGTANPPEVVFVFAAPAVAQVPQNTQASSTQVPPSVPLPDMVSGYVLAFAELAHDLPTDPPWVMGNNETNLKVLLEGQWVTEDDLVFQAFRATLRTQGNTADIYLTKLGSSRLEPLTLWWEPLQGEREFPIMLSQGDYLVFRDLGSGELQPANNGQPIRLSTSTPDILLTFP